MMEQVEIERRLTSIGECPLCGGIAFNYDITVISLELLSDEEKEKARLKVREGIQLRQLLEEFEEISIYKMSAWECEKCGHQDSSPKHTTM